MSRNPSRSKITNKRKIMQMEIAIGQHTNHRFVGAFLLADQEIAKFKLELLLPWKELIVKLSELAHLKPTPKLVSETLFTVDIAKDKKLIHIADDMLMLAIMLRLIET